MVRKKTHNNAALPKHRNKLKNATRKNNGRMALTVAIPIVLIALVLIVIFIHRSKEVASMGAWHLLLLALLIMVAALFLTCIIIAFNHRRHNELLQERDSLKKSHDVLLYNQEFLEVALEGTTVSIWNYDYSTKSIIQNERSIKMHGFGPTVENVPESMIENGYIHPECAAEFLEMYDKLAKGAETAEGIFKVRNANREEYWYECVRYTNLFDENGVPIRAIGMSEDVTEKLEAEKRYKKELQFRQTLATDIFATFVLNLSKRTLDNADINVTGEKNSTSGITFENFFEKAAAEVLNSEQTRRSFLALNAETLTGAYDNGQQTISFEYLRKASDGSEMWVSLEIHLLQDPDSFDLFAFVYIKDINKQKRDILLLEERAKSDSLTGLTNSGAAKKMITEYILGEGNNQLGAFLLIDLDDFKNINDEFSHYEGDRILIRIAEQLKSMFLTTDVVARIGGDEFVVFLKNVPSRSFVRSTAQEVCNSLQLCSISGEREINVSCSIGISICDNGDKTFDTLYREADVALYNAKDIGKKCFVLMPDHKHPEEYSDNDIELLNKAQDALRKTSNTNVQLSALLQYMDGGILLLEVGENLKTLYISPSFFTMTSITPEQAGEDGNGIFEFIYPKDLDLLCSAIKKGAATHEVVDVAYRVFIIGSGKVGWRHLRGVIIPYEGSSLPVMLAVVTDITELRESSMQLQAIFDYAPSGIARFIISDKWITDFANEEYIKRFYPKDTEKMRKIIDNAAVAVHPDDLQGLSDAIKEAAESGESFEHVYRSSDIVCEHTKWLMVHGVRIGTKDGKPVMLGIFNDITARKLLEKELNEDKQKLSLAFEQTDMMLWEYNPENKSVYIHNEKLIYENLPDEHIKNGFIHPDSVQDYIDFYKLMNSDADSGSCIIKMRHIGSDFNWYKLSFKNIFDESGILQKSVGITIRFSYIDAQKARFEQEEQFGVELSSHMLGTCKANLTRRTIESLSLNTNADDVELSDYDEFINYVSANITDNEDAYTFSSKFSVEALVNAFEMGNSYVSCECRRNTRQGRIEWVSVEASMIADPVSGELYCFGYMRLIDACKRWELSLDRKAERDAATLLYTDETIEAMVRHILIKNSGESNTLCAMLLIDLHEIENIIENNGFDVASKALFTIGRLYRSLLGHNNVIGMADEKTIAIFMPNVESEDSVIQKNRETTMVIRKLWNRSVLRGQFDLNSGIAVASAVGATYNELYLQARRALELGETAITVDLTNRDNSSDISEKEIASEKKSIIELTDALRNMIPCLTADESEVKKAFLADSLSTIKKIREVGERIAEESMYIDTLTGLCNQNSFEERLDGFDDSEVSSLGIVYADINGFGRLNREIGVNHSKKAVIAASDLFCECFGKSCVYRISASRFVVFSTNLSYNTFRTKCESVREHFLKRHAAGMSIGYTWTDRDIKAEKVLTHAKALMKLQRQVYFEEQAQSTGKHNNVVLTQLLSDIKNENYRVFLQPKADMETGKIIGAEALVRFFDSNGIVPPIKFIPLLERENIIRHLDLFVLEEVMKAMQIWRKSGRDMLPVAVNFSRTTLFDRTSLGRAVEIVKQYDIPIEMVELEITESIGSIERATVAEACEKYIASGFKLTLDDFGSEYSSLSIVSAIPFRVLKIDKTLVNDIVSNKEARAIIENTVLLCKRLGMDIVAEGVETEEQMRVLRDCGCRFGQGYYFNKPLAVPDFEKKYIKNANAEVTV